jgi:hypothetical protein
MIWCFLSIIRCSVCTEILLIVLSVRIQFPYLCIHLGYRRGSLAEAKCCMAICVLCDNGAENGGLSSSSLGWRFLIGMVKLELRPVGGNLYYMITIFIFCGGKFNLQSRNDDNVVLYYF